MVGAYLKASSALLLWACVLVANGYSQSEAAGNTTPDSRDLRAFHRNHKVFNWTDKAQIPADLPVSAQDSVVLLLSNSRWAGSYSNFQIKQFGNRIWGTLPEDLIVIADHLVIAEPVFVRFNDWPHDLVGVQLLDPDQWITFSGDKVPDGGNLTIIVNELYFEKGAYLLFYTSGIANATGVGDGGGLNIFANKITYAPHDSTDDSKLEELCRFYKNDGPKDMPTSFSHKTADGTVLFFAADNSYSSRKRYAAPLDIASECYLDSHLIFTSMGGPSGLLLTMPAGSLRPNMFGGFLSPTDADLLKYHPKPFSSGKAGRSHVTQNPSELDTIAPGNFISKWRLAMMKQMVATLASAIARDQPQEMLAAITRVRGMPFAQVSLSQADQQEFEDQLQKYSALEAQCPHVIRSDLTSQRIDGIPISISAFSDVDQSTYQLLPTDLLIVPQWIEGKAYLGAVKAIDAAGTILKIEITATLYVDPFVANFVEQQSNGELGRQSGLFRSWHLTSNEIALPGANNCELSADGENVRISITTTTNNASDLLWALNNQPGLPIPFAFISDREQKFAGSFTLDLTAAKLAHLPLTIKDRQVTNNGKYPILLSYFLDGGIPRRLDSQNVEVDPNGTISLPELQHSAEIPGSAAINVRRTASLEDFYFSKDVQISETVEVRCGLDRQDATIHRELDHISFTISATAPGLDWAPPGSKEVTLDPDKSITFEFLKPTSNSLRYIVDGKAHYKDGSYVLFKKESFGEAPIIIEEPDLIFPTK